MLRKATESLSRDIHRYRREKMIAEKIFTIFKRVYEKPFNWVTTLEMNILYNVSERAKRDQNYRLEIEKFDTGMGDSLINLIDKFFMAYNTSYGLDIRDSLVIYEDDSMSGGCYFKVESYKKEGATLVPKAATEFMPGETCTLTFALKSRDNDAPIKAPKLCAVWFTEDKENSCVLDNADTISIDSSKFIYHPTHSTYVGEKIYFIDSYDGDNYFKVFSE